ncbi:FxLYD domain-containing protein [Natrononativus amylolyticus]|uniref:FxLYD domain-containing protein n=1 Tax=Natrononativus amylolyticus TaxID=2963434 RepID=UPI0020CD4DAB|nr:FxLYD domain-containing protein [Natrononativus amylolyticus]
MKRRAFLAVAVLTPGCLDYFEENGEDLREPENLVIVYDELVRDDPGTEDERVYVWGVVRNEGERELSYVEIRATFLDEEGEELDTVIENVEDVTSGEEWEFEIEFPDFGERAAEVAEYELEPATSV